MSGATFGLILAMSLSINATITYLFIVTVLLIHHSVRNRGIDTLNNIDSWVICKRSS